MEATASYEWFVRLIEPVAQRVVLAHPKKLRVIAESTRKSDRLDAQILAEFLALDMNSDVLPGDSAAAGASAIGASSRRRSAAIDVCQKPVAPHSLRLQRRSSQSVQRRGVGVSRLQVRPLGERIGSLVDQMVEELHFGRRQLLAVNAPAEGVRRGKRRSASRKAADALLRTIPGVGFVTTEVVLAELADIDRFGSQKAVVVAYAGLSPGQRESAGKSRELHLEKNGSTLLQLDALVEAAPAAGSALVTLASDL